MSEHNLILEFYKPTYNLDFDYDGDGGLDLHFTNIKGEFFMTMNDSYNSVYIEDEDCEFSKGEMFATVDLGDLVERIINGEFRQTNGKAISDWGKRFIGDDEERIEFNGNNYADGSLFWDDFFKEMPKDEIKDFMTFCEDYLYLPNIEVDTVSNKWDFENGKVELKSNDKWGIGISDDYNIISVDEFTCDSTDAFVAYDVASSESDEDDFYESKKSARKNFKESKIDYVFEDLANEYADEYCNSHGGNFTKESIRQAFLDGCNDKKAPKGYHEFVAWQAGQRQIGKKSLKESTNDDIENYIDDLRTYSKKDVPSYSKSYYFWSYYEFNISDNEWTKVSLSGRDYAKSLKDANNLAKSDDVVKAYLVFKNPNNSNENFKVIVKENDLMESKKSAKKSLKEEAMTTKLFRFIQDLYDVHYITEEQLNKFQKHDFSKKEIKVLEQNYEIYKNSNEFDEINNAIKSTVNMINSFKESLKESTDEDFSLYDLNKHDSFVKEWVKNINKELKDVSIESIGDDEIVFRVWFDETMDLDIFDDIVTDCMPKTLIEFMSDMNIDFGYQFVYEDDKFTENDFVFIRFVAW